jgi:hypothetical protein
MGLSLEPQLPFHLKYIMSDRCYAPADQTVRHETIRMLRCPLPDGFAKLEQRSDILSLHMYEDLTSHLLIHTATDCLRRNAALEFDPQLDKVIESRSARTPSYSSPSTFSIFSLQRFLNNHRVKLPNNEAGIFLLQAASTNEPRNRAMVSRPQIRVYR